MPKCPTRSRPVSASACRLTLPASDDFNLMQMLLPPSAPKSEGLLPLDDPNSDFTVSSRSPETTTTDRRRKERKDALAGARHQREGRPPFGGDVIRAKGLPRRVQVRKGPFDA
jgi:hypothetical protein